MRARRLIWWYASVNHANLENECTFLGSHWASLACFFFRKITFPSNTVTSFEFSGAETHLSSLVWRSMGSCVSLSMWKRTSGEDRVRALKQQRDFSEELQEHKTTTWTSGRRRVMKAWSVRKDYCAILPHSDSPFLYSTSLQDLRQLVQASEALGDVIVHALIVNSHLSLGVGERSLATWQPTQQPQLDTGTHSHTHTYWWEVWLETQMVGAIWKAKQDHSWHTNKLIIETGFRSFPQSTFELMTLLVKRVLRISALWFISQMQEKASLHREYKIRFSRCNEIASCDKNPHQRNTLLHPFC